MLKKRVSGKLRKNKANRWIKNTGMGRKLPKERKGGLETYEVREGHRGKKTAGRKKRKV